MEAEIDARNQLNIVFVVVENYFNGDVDVTGAPTKTNPKAPQLVAASKLDLGELFSKEKVEQAMERQKKVLADNGYYKASVSYSLRPHDDTRQMDVSFHVEPGEQARVGVVSILGDTGIPADKVRSLTKLKGGDRVRAEHVTRALERLRKHYQKNDHLEAQVLLTDRNYHPESNRLDYNFKVDEGPTVAIRADGEKISQGQIKKLVPVYQENSVDDDLLNEGRRNLRDYLQTKGYFDATVDLERQESANQTARGHRLQD